MEIKKGPTVISLVRGDITVEETDAIVNAANAHLAGGGGVDGAIHAAGGPKIMEECRKFNGCPTGKAVITSSGKLKARYVIHTVGPIYRDGSHNEAKLLESAYRSSLEVAVKNGIKTIAFPSISTGAYGYPLEEAAGIAIKTVLHFVENHKGALSLVRFTLFSDAALKAYSEALKELAA
jgi:O-acetyl-ADP-ribose deacetylase